MQVARWNWLFPSHAPLWGSCLGQKCDLGDYFPSFPLVQGASLLLPRCSANSSSPSFCAEGMWCSQMGPTSDISWPEFKYRPCHLFAAHLKASVFTSLNLSAFFCKGSVYHNELHNPWVYSHWVWTNILDISTYMSTTLIKTHLHYPREFPPTPFCGWTYSLYEYTPI